MSWAVEDWVWRSCTVEDHLHRYVLLAIAWHTDADGLTSRGPSFDRLAEMVREDRKRVMAVVDALEDAHELLVWRAPDDHRGRRPANRYAVVMGRAPHDVRQLAEAPRPRAYAPPLAGTDQPSGTDQPGAATAQPTASRHRPGRTPSSVRPRSGFGPPSVHSRSSAERAGGLGLGPGPGRASASRSSPARAAPPPDPRLEPLRCELDGIDVSWQMTDEQATAMAALIEVHGPRPLAQVALDLVTARGKPTFARAWLGAWRELPVPGAVADRGVRTSDVPAPRPEAAWCGQCDDRGYRWEVDEAGLPLRPCPRCHQTSTAPAPF
jgi:hypothetical protein